MLKRPLTSPPHTDELSDEEEAEVQAQIDNENPELTGESFARMRPAREVLPPDLYEKLAGKKRLARAINRSERLSSIEVILGLYGRTGHWPTARFLYAPRF